MTTNSNRTALITVASRGIGRAAARACGRGYAHQSAETHKAGTTAQQLRPRHVPHFDARDYTDRPFYTETAVR
jgi:NAD(P)-dependent dehydrogenase (short-subunit alcohol dehydrogenase family)